MLHRSSDPILRASYPSAIRRVDIQTRGAKNTVVHHASECNRFKKDRVIVKENKKHSWKTNFGRTEITIY